MHPENIINVNIIIADRTYPLKVKASEESLVREASRRINEKVKEFQGVYDGKDKQDYLAMAILIFATDIIKSENSSSGNMPENLEQKLKELDSILSFID